MFDALTRFHALVFGAFYFYCLTSLSFGALHIFTGKAEVDNFAVLIFTENAHFQWIRSHIFWSSHSAPRMGTGKNRLINLDIQCQGKRFYLGFLNIDDDEKGLTCVNLAKLSSVVVGTGTLIFVDTYTSIKACYLASSSGCFKFWKMRIN